MEFERILITGCGRSGTSHASALLSALDLCCGHETVFNLRAVTGGEVDWPADLIAESSWLAAPFLAALPAGTAILHQVRHPLDVIRSLVRIRLFAGGDAYAAFIDGQLEGINSAPALEACMRYWDEWNALVERQAHEAGLFYRRYNVEDLQPVFLSKLLADLGHFRSTDEIETRSKLVRADANTRGDKSGDDQLTWESLPECDAKHAVQARALEYGFGILA